MKNDYVFAKVSNDTLQREGVESLLQENSPNVVIGEDRRLD